jgi:hypothetical protein
MYEIGLYKAGLGPAREWAGDDDLDIEGLESEN